VRTVAAPFAGRSVVNRGAVSRHVPQDCLRSANVIGSSRFMTTAVVRRDAGHYSPRLTACQAASIASRVSPCR
jgi:hypothetical protein